MNRRNLLRRIGATGIATATIAGISTSTATADEQCCPICCKNLNVDDPMCPCYVCDDSICA